MYRLLIVDDELPAVHALQFAIDWETYGIGDICIASNAVQAREALMIYQVDIIICDIQMPGENGVELMQWVLARFPGIQFVFLSVHEDSAYVREAIHHGCLDYLLKPVNEQELIRVIKNATAQLERQEQYRQLDEAQEQVNVSKGDMYISFWRSLIFRELCADRETIMAEGRRRGLIFSDSLMLDHYMYFPLLVRVREWHETFGTAEKHRIFFAIRNVCEEGVINGGCIGQFFRIGDRLIGGCFMLPDHLSIRSAGLEQAFEQIGQTVRRYYACSIQMLVGSLVRIWQMPDEMQRLFDAERTEVSDQMWRYCSAEDPMPVEWKTMPELEAWSGMVSVRANDRLEKAVRTYLNNGGNHFTADALRQFRRMFSQMIYDKCRTMQKLSYYMVENREIVALEEEARNSIDGTVRWCMALALQYQRLVGENSGYEHIDIEGICAYIDTHLDENLGRDQLAARYYLNPDYLGRLFKKEKGQVLSAYIQNKRIRRACQLLTQTQLPIGEIAAQVGVPNFSYFCKLFKDVKGESPQNYRKMYDRR